jgi:UDP-N-acetylmuramate--alanine ligase
VFQPHRYTRTADLGPAFGVPLAGADHVIVTDIYSAGEQPIIGVSGRVVVQATEAAGGSAAFVRVLADVPGHVASIAAEGDTVLLLGAGDITTIAAEVTKAIEASP